MYFSSFDYLNFVSGFTINRTIKYFFLKLLSYFMIIYFCIVNLIMVFTTIVIDLKFFDKKCFKVIRISNEFLKVLVYMANKKYSYFVNIIVN